ncbi:hypothetical protein [Geotalea sp. SG265]|uniref:carboxylate--amine ligase n=1 Tax=Geotalea sp. SG265 TaxID=2922867 RepID=UPI001FAF2F2C|nr:hypothetical protein [Geotalea sp. SG265]
MDMTKAKGDCDGQHRPEVAAVILSSHTTALGVIRSLGMMGVPITNVYYQRQDMGYVSRYVSKRVSAPHPERNEEQFIALLVSLATSEKQILVPADDATLSVVSRYLAVLEKHYIVACTDWSVAELFIDKKYTYELAEREGIPVPRTLVPSSKEDVERFASKVIYPCLVKPRQSHRYFEAFRKKMVKVESKGELVAAYDEAANAGIGVMLQEYIPGDDTRGINYNAYFWEGKALVEFTAEKVRLAPPGFGVPSVVKSKDVPEVAGYGRRLLRALRFRGYACTEFKKDPRDGTYKLMEINGRHNRSALLALRCGINFPWFQYRHLVDGKVPSIDFPPILRENIYWIDEFKDVGRLTGKPGCSLLSFARPYLAPHVFAVFALNDFKPFIKRCVDSVRVLASFVAAPEK